MKLEKRINEDYLLILVRNDSSIATAELEIITSFKEERKLLDEYEIGPNDNIDCFVDFIRDLLKKKLPNKVFNYCKELDLPYQSVLVNVEEEITNIYKKRDLIKLNHSNAIADKKEYDLKYNLLQLKNEICEMICLWFHVFDIELTYERANKTSNCLVYSHRLSGWSKPEFKITENLTQEIRTNFGYGSASYFYCILKYKNIQITPLSEWINYRLSKFSEVIRYTRSFKSWEAIFNKDGKYLYSKSRIDNEYWSLALNFTMQAANLSLADESKFIDEYIISECELMINGLERIYYNVDVILIEGKPLETELVNTKKYKLDVSGFELVEFKAEKIIGALDFVDKINEYNSIVPTQEYLDKILEFCKMLIPQICSALHDESLSYNYTSNKYESFMISSANILEKFNFFEEEKTRLGANFGNVYESQYQYKEFVFEYFAFFEEKRRLLHNVNLHLKNVNKLQEFVDKYDKFNSL